MRTAGNAQSIIHDAKTKAFTGLFVAAPEWLIDVSLNKFDDEGFKWYRRVLSRGSETRESVPGGCRFEEGF